MTQAAADAQIAAAERKILPEGPAKLQKAVGRMRPGFLTRKAALSERLRLVRNYDGRKRLKPPVPAAEKPATSLPRDVAVVTREARLRVFDVQAVARERDAFLEGRDAIFRQAAEVLDDDLDDEGARPGPRPLGLSRARAGVSTPRSADPLACGLSSAEEHLVSVQRAQARELLDFVRDSGPAALERIRRQSGAASAARPGPGPGPLRPGGRPSRPIPQAVKARRAEETRVLLERRAFAKRVLEHGAEMREHLRKLRARTAAACNQLHAVFRDKEKKRVQEEERRARERLRALKENDEEGYMRMLEESKNERLMFLVRQTDSYLREIGAAVSVERERADGSEDRPAAAGTGDAHEGGASKAADVLRRQKDVYYALTHTRREAVGQPAALRGGTLKPYQLEGLEWMVSLYNNNLNGILADEMGLGKTIQTIALVAYLIEVKRSAGPFLIVAPLSVVSNWSLEFEKWAPSVGKARPTRPGPLPLRLERPPHHLRISFAPQASPRPRDRPPASAPRALLDRLSSPSTFVLKDKSALARRQWEYIILDEGHRIKNSQGKLATTLGTEYRSRHRLLLSGTPLQNNLRELWSLLNFLLPSIFRSSQDFDRWFTSSVEGGSVVAAEEGAALSEEEQLLVIHRLHQVLRPFLLRRMKAQVLAQLPQKVELVLRCAMSSWQRALYDRVVAAESPAPDAPAGAGAFRRLNNAVMQLRKICNHPYIAYPAIDVEIGPEVVAASGKLALLDSALPKLRAAGHKVLLFSQMTQALDVIQEYAEWRGWEVLRLDGGTKAEDREDLVKRFNAPDSPHWLFLLSTRAGGLGLNLQTADTVVIFDSDWNPHADAQALDRAHRIGQTREVRVFRLSTGSPIEARILARASEKRGLDEKVIQAGMYHGKATEEERRAALASLLRRGDGAAGCADGTDPARLNELLARGEEERALFERMDADGPPPVPLMAGEEEIPEWARAEMAAESALAGAALEPPTEADEEEAGRPRSRRRRAAAGTVCYSESAVNDEVWSKIVEEGGDPREYERRRLAAAAAKRAAGSAPPKKTKKARVSPEGREEEGEGAEEGSGAGASNSPRDASGADAEDASETVSEAGSSSGSSEGGSRSGGEPEPEAMSTSSD
eukprot:tig00000545_g1983.t1